MGKGKGLFERRIIRVSKNTILFEFIGIPFFKLNFLIKKINKKLSIKTTLLSNKLIFYKSVPKKGFGLIYYSKYFKFN